MTGPYLDAKRHTLLSIYHEIICVHLLQQSTSNPYAVFLRLLYIAVIVCGRVTVMHRIDVDVLEASQGPCRIVTVMEVNHAGQSQTKWYEIYVACLPYDLWK